MLENGFCRVAMEWVLLECKEEEDLANIEGKESKSLKEPTRKTVSK